MTDCLRGLERDGLVTRRIYAQVPVRVEYSLTPLGWTITNAIVALSEWGKHHSGDVTRARSEYWLRGTETDDIICAAPPRPDRATPHCWRLADQVLGGSCRP